MNMMEQRVSDVERELGAIRAVLAETAALQREGEARYRQTEEQFRLAEERREEERQRAEKRREEQRQRAEERREEWRQRAEERREEQRRLASEKRAAEERAYDEADKQRREEWSREQSAKIDRQMGEFSNKFGRLVEDIVSPGLPTVMQEVFGHATIDLEVQRLYVRHRTDRGRMREFDSVVAAGDIVLVTEVKSELRPGDIPKFIRALGEIRGFLPVADGRRVYGAVASFSLHPSLVVAGEKRGLLMFGLGTGLLRVLNTAGFQPRCF